MTARGARLGWAAFALLGCAAAVLPGPVQFAYAAAAIVLLGLPHGASDLALVPAHRRMTFVAAYLACFLLALAWWRVAPFGALIALLLMSATHFAVEDAPATRPVERVCRGVLMVAGPALLHRAELGGLLASATAASEAARLLARAMALLAAVAMVLLPFVLGARWRDGERAGAATLGAGVLALVAMPPLVGFAIGFVLLHARAQLRERMAALECPDLGGYLRRTAPVLAGAVALVGMVAIWFAAAGLPGASTLFAGIAALATPHMLVTPLWAARARYSSMSRILPASASMAKGLVIMSMPGARKSPRTAARSA